MATSGRRQGVRTRTAERAPARPAEARAWRAALPGRYALVVAASGLLLASAAASTAQGALAPARGVLTGALTAAGLACAIGAGIRGAVPEPWRRVYTRVHLVALAAAAALALESLVVLGLTAYLTFALPSPVQYPTDAIAYTHVNAELVVEGEDPYTSANAFGRALRSFPSAPVTPVRRGIWADTEDVPNGDAVLAVERLYLASPESLHGELDPAIAHSYPALSFLVYVPLIWAGVGNIVVLHLLVYAALGGWLVWLAPVGVRRWAALAAAAGGAVQAYSLRADTEVVCIALVLAAWHYRERRWMGPVLLGLACAFKQYCWLFVPFFALDVLRARGWREAARRGVVALGAFLLPNLPYLVASPGAWVHSLWLPMGEPLFAYGTGLIALSIGHALPYAPQWVYAALEVAALGAVMWCGVRWRERLLPVLPLLGLVPLFFAFRSLANYFAFAPWLGLYAASWWYARCHATEPGANQRDQRDAVSAVGRA